MRVVGPAKGLVGRRAESRGREPSLRRGASYPGGGTMPTIHPAVEPGSRTSISRIGPMKDNGPIALDPARFRAMMGAFPTGVAVVTTRRPDGSPSGLTVNSLTSVSLNPLLLLVCIDHSSASHATILESGAFAVNLLGEGDSLVSDTFARSGRDERFEGLAWRDGSTESPILEQALGWIDCRVHQTHVAGDHTIVVGRVEAFDVDAGWPLVYHRGRYARLERG